MNKFMFLTKTALVVFTCFALAACAIRPIIGDVGFSSRINKQKEDEYTPTIEIVERIRCEARYSVAKVTMDFLKSDFAALRKNYGHLSVVKTFFSKIEYKPGKYSFNRLIDEYYIPEESQFNFSVLKQLAGSGNLNLQDELAIVQNFANSGVGYTFEFTTTENNNFSNGKLGFEFERNGGKSVLGLAGASERERKNTRTFTLAETIENLVLPRMIDGKVSDAEKKRIQECDEINFSEKENWNYPIYGKINLHESFKTFANLVLKFNLGNEQEVKPKIKSQTFQDVISFTTTHSGTLSPSIELSPIATGARINMAAIDLVGKRTDNHKLTLILQENGVNELLKVIETERFLSRGGFVVPE